MADIGCDPNIYLCAAPAVAVERFATHCRERASCEAMCACSGGWVARPTGLQRQPVLGRLRCGDDAVESEYVLRHSVFNVATDDGHLYLVQPTAETMTNLMFDASGSENLDGLSSCIC